MNFPYILLAILFFGVLIFIHELGHFIVARLCGVRVLEFAIGMGPKLFSVRSKKSGIKYSLRLFPIGGFVSMLGENGMETVQGSNDWEEYNHNEKKRSFFVNENEDVQEQPKKVDPELAKQAYCNQSVWKRLLISFAGPFMNVSLGFVLMLVLVLAQGPNAMGSNTVGAFFVEYSAEESVAGLQKGDNVEALNGFRVRSMADLKALVSENPSEGYSVVVDRLVDGKIETITLNNVPLSQAFLESHFDYSRSEQANLQINDKILKVNNTRVHTADEVSYEIFNQGYKPLTLTVLRGGEKVELTNVMFPTGAEQGVTYGTMDFKLYQEDFKFTTVLKHTFWRSCSTVKMVFDSLGGLFSGRYGVEAVSGPIGITQAITTAAKSDWKNVLSLLVMISINLGVMNLLPLPALDGGHIMIYLIEVVRRKPLKPEVEGIINFVGLAVLLGLAIIISIKDVISL